MLCQWPYIVMLKLPSIFSSDNKRTQIIKRNVFYSAGIKGISIIISLLLVPLTINYVSSEIYGIWLTLSSIISWLSFFDVGFGLGLRNRLTTAIALGDYNKGKIYVSTTYSILTIIFVIVAVVGYILSGIVNWCSLLSISPEYNDILVISSRIVVITFCASIVLKLIQNVFQAYQMTAAAASIDTVSQIISLILIYVLTETTFPNLNYLALVFCCAPIIVYVVYSIFLYCGRFKAVAPTFSSIDFKYAKDLFSLGSQFFLIQIICIIIYQSVNFVISHYCGPEQVTVYNIAYKYLYCALMVFNIIMAPLWSAYNDAYAKNDYNWMKSIYGRLIKVNLIVIIALIVMIAVSPIVYYLWIGDSVTIPFVISILIGLYIVCQTISTMHASILNGMGVIRIQIIQAVMQGVLFVGSILLIGNSLNLIGILIIMLLTSVIPAVILPIQVRMLLNNRAKGIWKK